MDYPTVKVRIDGPKVSAEVDITPKPDATDLVTECQEDQPSPAPVNNSLPNWMLYAG